MKPKKGLGKAIAVARVSRGLSQFDLGVVVGLSQQKIFRLESGQQRPTAAELEKIGAALDLTALVASVKSVPGSEYCQPDRQPRARLLDGETHAERCRSLDESTAPAAENAAGEVHG